MVQVRHAGGGVGAGIWAGGVEEHGGRGAPPRFPSPSPLPPALSAPFPLSSPFSHSSLPPPPSPHAHTPFPVPLQYGDAMERDEDQFAALLSASGFRLNKVVPTKSLLFVLEALPV